MTSHVEQAVKARIAAARRRTEDMRRQRAELAAARKRGLAARHAQKLRNLRGADGHAAMGQSPTVARSHEDLADGTETATTAASRGDMTTTDSVRTTDGTVSVEQTEAP